MRQSDASAIGGPAVTTTTHRIPLADFKQVAIFALLMVLLVCYTTFLTADIFTGNHNNTWSWIVKHFAGLLCFVLTLLIGRHSHDERDKFLIRLALGLAVIADLFMGFGMKLPGTLVFVLVQITLIIRHKRDFVWNRTELIGALAVYLPIGAIFLYLAPAMHKAGMLIPGLIYTSLLATSVWIGIGTVWRRFYVPTVSRIVAVAIVAFFLCDLSLGLLDDKPRKEGLDGIQQLADIKDHQSFVPAEEPEATMLAKRPAPPATPDVAAPVPDAEKTIAESVQGVLDEFARARLEAAAEITKTVPHDVIVGFGVLIWFFYLPALTLLAMSGFKLEYLRSILPIIPVRKRED